MERSESIGMDSLQQRRVCHVLHIALSSQSNESLICACREHGSGAAASQGDAMCTVQRRRRGHCCSPTLLD
eukprot:6099812-Amphidinium_carterae.1